ncbi:unnamed protein product [Alopecurus aequalis]
MTEAARPRAAPLHRGLPDEISIWEILVRLPPKALLRCPEPSAGAGAEPPPPATSSLPTTATSPLSHSYMSKTSARPSTSYPWTTGKPPTSSIPSPDLVSVRPPTCRCRVPATVSSSSPQKLSLLHWTSPSATRPLVSMLPSRCFVASTSPECTCTLPPESTGYCCTLTRH